ncbi:MAG: MFS transporter [Bacteroidales bacterium]|nr:MFS transporter [Bacteroidales bacterium]
MNKGLFALAMGTFSLGIAEFLMMGILSEIAQGLGIDVAKAGHLISAYALGVCAGAVLLLFARNLPLRRLMVILGVLIAVGNLCAAAAWSFGSLFAFRFVSGLPHGCFFGVGAIVAQKIAEEGKQVRAVAYMIAGMTVANLVGVPAGTFLTNNFSWRLAFLIVGICGTLTAIALRMWIPALPALENHGFKSQFRFLKTLPPWLIFGGVLFGQIGLYCWYSYIDPQLTRVSGFTQDDLSWLMVLAGAGMVGGNLMAGRLSDRFKPAAVACSVQAAGLPVLILFFLFGSCQWAAVVLMMAGTAVLFGSGSPLQSSIVGYSRGGEFLGAACIQIAYNAGNAVAAFLGGAVLSAGWGLRSVSLVGMPFIGTGCVLLLVLYLRFERNR